MNSEFTTFIGEVLEQELAEALNKSQNFSIFAHGLNDATEREIIYILCLTETGETTRMFLTMRDVPNTTAKGRHQNISEVLQAIGAKELHTKLVEICSHRE